MLLQLNQKPGSAKLANDKLVIFFLFVPENRACLFMIHLFWGKYHIDSCFVQFLAFIPERLSQVRYEF